MPLRKALKFPRPSLEAQCTHTTMTRVYGAANLCCACHRPGSFGWVYQCTQDQEGIIDDALAQGDLVQAMIQQDRMTQNGTSLFAHDGLLDLTEPLPNPYEYRKLMNAVADGQFPPTAATGFSFHSIAGRPVTDARLVKTIGQRPVPSLATPLVAQIESLPHGPSGATDCLREPPPCPGTLTRSPPCNNLEAISQLLPEDPPVCVAPEPAFQSESSPLFDISPILGVHTRGDTDSSYTNLRLGAGNGFERGISDMITAA
ncbi:hypothetical protein ACQRIT_005920 [Beauveria bassiana]